MKNEAYVDAITFSGTMSIIFTLCYAFNISQSPVLLMLIGMMSFGYMLFLLGFGNTKTGITQIIYCIIGIFLVGLCVLCSFTLPHSPVIFY